MAAALGRAPSRAVEESRRYFTSRCFSASAGIFCVCLMCGAFVSPATLKPSIQRQSMMERHLSAPHGPYNRHLHATDNEVFIRVHTKGPCYWVRDSPPKPERVHKQYWFLVPSCNAMLARWYHMLVLFIETPASKKWSFGMWLILFQLYSSDSGYETHANLLPMGRDQQSMGPLTNLWIASLVFPEHWGGFSVVAFPLNVSSVFMSLALLNVAVLSVTTTTIIMSIVGFILQWPQSDSLYLGAR